MNRFRRRASLSTICRPDPCGPGARAVRFRFFSMFGAEYHHVSGLFRFREIASGGPSPFRDGMKSLTRGWATGLEMVYCRPRPGTGRRRPEGVGRTAILQGLACHRVADRTPGPAFLSGSCSCCAVFQNSEREPRIPAGSVSLCDPDGSYALATRALEPSAREE